MTSSDPNKPDNRESFKEKLTKKLNNIKKGEKIDGLFSYAKSNTKDTIAYILLIIGLILLFFHPHYGGLLIGIIVGLYFSDEAVFIATHLNELIDEQGLVRVLVLAALTASFIIVLPTLFLGIIIGAVIMRAIASQ